MPEIKIIPLLKYLKDSPKYVYQLPNRLPI